MLAGWVKSRFIDDGIYVVEPTKKQPGLLRVYLT